MPYDALLVDLDGVIRHWNTSDEPIETAFGLAAGSIRKAAFSPDLLDLAVTGAIADEEWRARTADKIQRTGTAPRAREAVALWTAQLGVVDRQVLSLLGRRDPATQLVLVTNATSRLPSDLAVLGLTEYFDAIVNSSEVGAQKPSESVFRFALERAGTVSERALFVDDTAAHVAAAERLGLRSHRFVDYDGLASFLGDAGVLVAGSS